LSYYIRPMTRQDLDSVTEIDREAFPTQWPPADYSYEFKNNMAHYVVACDPGITVETRTKGSNGQGSFSRWLGKIIGRSPAPHESSTSSHYIVGFTGFWVMAGEAHITSIAVREDYRRKGIGELLMIAVFELALKLQADVVTLEVRASNVNAQNLYTKYGFKAVGERRRYYLDRAPSGDTREDALIMTTDKIASPGFQKHLDQLRKSHELRWHYDYEGIKSLEASPASK
jgi:ribosomal-protein-alanine N-acetyltransferase